MKYRIDITHTTPFQISNQRKKTTSIMLNLTRSEHNTYLALKTHLDDYKAVRRYDFTITILTILYFFELFIYVFSHYRLFLDLANNYY